MIKSLIAGAVALLALPLALSATPAPFDVTCSGPECIVHCTVSPCAGCWNQPFFHYELDKTAGAVNVVDSGCFDCKNCTVEVSVWEDSNASWTYSGSGVRGTVSNNEASPTVFTLSRGCREDGQSTVEFDRAGQGGADDMILRFNCNDPC